MVEERGRKVAGEGQLSRMDHLRRLAETVTEDWAAIKRKPMAL